MNIRMGKPLRSIAKALPGPFGHIPIPTTRVVPGMLSAMTKDPRCSTPPPEAVNPPGPVNTKVESAMHRLVFRP
jgi:hypothetical protein